MARLIGCAGCGNMGSALLAGFAASLDQKMWKLICFDADKQKMEALASKGVETAQSASDLVQKADIVILAVKPGQINAVLSEAAPHLGKDKALVSIAAGVRLAVLRDQAGDQCGIARCMPTTTARAGRGVFAFCFDPLNLAENWKNDILHIFGKIGVCQELPETSFANYSALIGAGPAYIFQTLQGLVQAGVTLGFSQAESRAMLVELLAGCAALAQMESSKPASQLRDDVCSPAGLTIAGVNVLDRAGFSGLLVDAILAARKRAKEMES